MRERPCVKHKFNVKIREKKATYAEDILKLGENDGKVR